MGVVWVEFCPLQNGLLHPVPHIKDTSLTRLTLKYAGENIDYTNIVYSTLALISEILIMFPETNKVAVKSLYCTVL